MLAIITHCSVVVLIFLISFGIFYNSLSNDFCFDDHLAIVNNKDTSPEYPHYELWRHDLWGKGLREFDSHRSFRPFLILLFRQFRAIYGLEPRPMRIFSIFCHSVCSIMVYLLGYEITGSALLGFGSAVLFASHPVHVESVAALVNMAEPIACIFYLIAYFAFWYSASSRKSVRSIASKPPTKESQCSKSTVVASATPADATPVSLNNIEVNMDIRNSNVIKRKDYGNSLKSSFFLFITTLLWWISILISMLFKETGVTLAGVAVASSAIDLLYLVGCQIDSKKLSFLSPISLLYELISNTTWLRRWLRYHIIWIIISFLSVGAYIALRMVTSLFDPVELIFQIRQHINNNNISLVDIYDWILSVVNATKGGIGGSLYLGKSDLIRRAENPFAFLHGQEKVLSLMYLHFRYFFVMLYPSQLSAEYAFDCIPKVSEWNDSRMIYVGGMYGGLLLLIIIGIYCVLVQQKTFDKITTSSNKYDVRLHSRSLLLSLVWLIVPFIPASGVFLRLGTLLAERLLYIPSIGFCLLYSILLFQICDFFGWLLFKLFGACYHAGSAGRSSVDSEDISNTTMPVGNVTNSITTTTDPGITTHSEPQPELTTEEVNDNCNHDDSSTDKLNNSLRKWQQTISKFFYLVAVTVTVILYSLKTVSRNPAWKDDKTLFLDSLEVCPRSAKLHLQVAKLRMNTANYTGARYHVDMARSIDPDFCDIDYQEALLQLFHKNDVEAAVEVAARNLPCIYTNMQSWELLSKVWEQQVQSRPNDPVLRERIGDICVKAGLAAIGAKKLQEAVNIAFNSKSYSVAIRASLKAENTVVDLLHPKDRILSDQEQVVMRELACSIIFLGASLRAFLLTNEAQTGKMIRLSDKDRQEVLRVRTVLHQAMGEDCVGLSATGEPLQYPLLAVRTLTNIMNMKLPPAIQLDTPRSDTHHPTDSNKASTKNKKSKKHRSKKNKMKRGAKAKAEKKRQAKARRDKLIKERLDQENKRKEKEVEASRLEEEGKSYAAIARYYSSMAYLYRNTSTVTATTTTNNVPSSITSSESTESNKVKSKEMIGEFKKYATTAVKSWESAGQIYFEVGRHIDAVRSFDLAMQWGVGVSSGRGSSKASSSGRSSTSSATTTTRLEFQGLSLSHPPATCDIYYWQAHALAGLESFAANRTLILQAISSLEEIFSEICSFDKSVTIELKESAEKQVAKLRETLTRNEVETESLPLYH